MNNSALLTYLSELRGKRLFYRPNPGNAGDAMIAAATISIFRRLGLTFELIGERVPDLRGQIIIHGGGGGFYNQNPVVADFIRHHAPNAKRFILLPQTIVGNEQLLEGLGTHVHLLCRERVSYDFLQILRLKAGVFLFEDVAFQLPVRDWMQSQSALSLFLRSPSRCFKGWRHFRATLKKLPDRHILYALRGDSEAGRPEMIHPLANVDISRAFALGCRKEAFINASAWFFLKFVDQFDQVVTDRLHVSIAGALLGKIVTLHPNRYFKNRAVYEHSLNGHFPNVRWQDWSSANTPRSRSSCD